MRLIDADVLQKKFEGLKEKDGHATGRNAYDLCAMLTEDAPTVDAVILPCKLGDPVFIIGGKYRAGRFEQWINTGKFRLSDLEKMGKSIFLTREEAEAALAERRTSV